MGRPAAMSRFPGCLNSTTLPVPRIPWSPAGEPALIHQRLHPVARRVRRWLDNATLSVWRSAREVGRGDRRRMANQRSNRYDAHDACFPVCVCVLKINCMPEGAQVALSASLSPSSQISGETNTVPAATHAVNGSPSSSPPRVCGRGPMLAGLRGAKHRSLDAIMTMRTGAKCGGGVQCRKPDT